MFLVLTLLLLVHITWFAFEKLFMGQAASRQPAKTPTSNLDNGGLFYVFISSVIVKYFSDSPRTIRYPMPNCDLALYALSQLLRFWFVTSTKALSLVLTSRHQLPISDDLPLLLNQEICLQYSFIVRQLQIIPLLLSPPTIESPTGVVKAQSLVVIMVLVPAYEVN